MIHIGQCRDIKELTSLYNEWSGKGIKQDYMLYNNVIIMAKDDGVVVGAAFLIIIDDPVWDRKWGLVENIYVKKSYRNNGVAKQLMKYLEVQAEAFGCQFIKLTSGYDKQIAHKLYEALGYKDGKSFKKVLQCVL